MFFTLFPYFLLQSTRFCSERLTSLPVARWCMASRAPVVEKLQHEPHWPWFLTGVTAPCFLQSTLRGRGPELAGIRYLAPSSLDSELVVFLPLYPFMRETNSWLRRSPNWFIFCE